MGSKAVGRSASHRASIRRVVVDGTQRVGAFVALPELIRQVGGDAPAALASVGLAPDALANPENRILFTAVGRLLHEVAESTRCAHFGLLVGRMWHLRDMGTAGEIMANSPTVGIALRKWTLYQHLNSDSVAPFVRETAGIVDIGPLIYESGLPGVDQLCNTYLAAIVNDMQDLCGTDWKPSAAYLPYSRPADITYHRHILKVQPHFDAEFTALRFPAHWMQLKVRNAEPSRLRAAEQRAATIGPPKIVQQVCRALRRQLLTGDDSGDAIAQSLSLHRRTLNRRLTEENTTFQFVLDQIRFDLACQLLAYSDISLDDVAASLGYAGVSPFMRSFHRLAGMSPGRWRRTFGARERKARVPSFRARLDRAA